MNANINFIFPPDKPAIPGAPLSTTEIGDTFVSLKWVPPESDGGSPITNYIIERRDARKNVWINVATIPSSSVDVVASKLIENQSYYFRVAAENEVGIGPFLETAEAVLVKKKISKKRRFRSI